MAGLKSLIKLPQPIKQSAITAGYTAGGMLANRFISSRLAGMFEAEDAEGKKGVFAIRDAKVRANVQLGFRVVTGIGIGVIAFQVAKKKEIATALTIGALADVLVEVWNGFAPENLRFSGDSLGLVFAEQRGIERQLPESVVSEISQFSGNGMGLPFLEVPQMI
ncbi:hypothetical protein IH992_34315 [Candidatus Poribacteria bacterium]|nr:hypothetical protein [Candidatus Poribacteria bacterium]